MTQTCVYAWVSEVWRFTLHIYTDSDVVGMIAGKRHWTRLTSRLAFDLIDRLRLIVPFAFRNEKILYLRAKCQALLVPSATKDTEPLAAECMKAPASMHLADRGSKNGRQNETLVSQACSLGDRSCVPFRRLLLFGRL